MKFLRPAVKSGEFTVWDDLQMSGGMKWNPEIERNLRACDIFVLLVSANSMSSNYIIDKELEIAREREAAGAGLHIYPLLIEPTPKAGLDRVRDFNLRPRDAKPLQSYSLADRNQCMSDAADEIATIAAGIAARRAAVAPRKSTRRAQAYVHTSGLPETGYERLVGRDLELKRLDEAWSDDKTNILSLVAEGGAGKSALVNEWLNRQQADGYRGSECVLGWSFYSQGSKESATASDEFLDWALAKLGVKLESTSAATKGETIAEALMARRALLVLDGVEPLQHGPGPQTGQLKDQGLRALLRRFAAAPPKADHSLIVLTSRLAVADLQRFRNGAAPVVDIERLSDEAGAELLRDNDVWGVDRDLRTASRDFAGHPLALSLLASFLKEMQNGDVRRRDHIRCLLADANNPRHDQARRVMESYEKEWLAGEPVLLAILHLVGLFDRPASGDCLKALRARPAIPGLTDATSGDAASCAARRISAAPYCSLFSRSGGRSPRVWGYTKSVVAVAQGASRQSWISVRYCVARPSSGSDAAREPSSRPSATASIAATLMPCPKIGLNRHTESPSGMRPRGKRSSRSRGAQARLRSEQPSEAAKRAARARAREAGDGVDGRRVGPPAAGERDAFGWHCHVIETTARSGIGVRKFKQPRRPRAMCSSPQFGARGVIELR